MFLKAKCKAALENHSAGCTTSAMAWGEHWMMKEMANNRGGIDQVKIRLYWPLKSAGQD